MKMKEVLILEKTMSSEERIRRAEEIYNRRREKYNGNIRVSSSSVNVNSKPEYAMFKKLILQVLICLLIYFIFYLIKNSDYIFSADILQKAKEFLSYDINFQNIYETVNNYYNDTKNWLTGFDENKKDDENINENILNNQNTEMVNQNIENVNMINMNEIVTPEQNNENAQQDNEGAEQNNQISEDTTQLTQLGIGGGETQTSADEADPQAELSEMEIDANEIKQNYSFIIPLHGTITSRYGPREETEIVSGNHKGIDIGVNEGTIFYAAMEGTVTEISGEGSYGNHIFIQNGDVITLYAHCKTIYLQEGETIKQGMQIGEVGSTGNATGPHLHFEIRKDGRTVNPEYILDF